MTTPDPAGEMTIKMGGEDFIVSTFAHTLRTYLWAEHLGFKISSKATFEVSTTRSLHNDCFVQYFSDPIEKFKIWTDQAYRNTRDCIVSHVQKQPVCHS